MSLFNRLTVWAANQLLKSADLNGEFNNLVNGLNNLDSATTAWTNVKGGLLNGTTSVTGVTVNGSTNLQKAGFNSTAILQIVSATTTSSSTTASGSFVNTNITGSITPNSTSSKVLLFASSCVGIGSGTATGFLTFARGGTNLLGSSGGTELTFSNAITMPWCLTYLDSPASTSALTYTVQARNGDGSTNIKVGDTNLTQALIMVEVL